MDVTLRREVLMLNKLHEEIGYFTPKQIFTSLSSWVVNARREWLLDKQGRKIRSMLAYDIEFLQNDDGSYDFETIIHMQLVDWDKWITLPIRSYDLVVHTPRQAIRIPRVVLSLFTDYMPTVRYSTSLDSIYMLYGGVDQYTGQQLTKKDASRDHYVPISRGGSDHISNLVLCSKEINSFKGNRLNSEIGLPEVKPKVPRELPIKAVLRNERNIPEWRYFIRN